MLSRDSLCNARKGLAIILLRQGFCKEEMVATIKMRAGSTQEALRGQPGDVTGAMNPLVCPYNMEHLVPPGGPMQTIRRRQRGLASVRGF